MIRHAKKQTKVLLLISECGAITQHAVDTTTALHSFSYSEVADSPTNRAESQWDADAMSSTEVAIVVIERRGPFFGRRRWRPVIHKFEKVALCGLWVSAAEEEFPVGGAGFQHAPYGGGGAVQALGELPICPLEKGALCFATPGTGKEQSRRVGTFFAHPRQSRVVVVHAARRCKKGEGACLPTP